jgi:hypothetical protein
MPWDESDEQAYLRERERYEAREDLALPSQKHREARERSENGGRIG